MDYEGEPLAASYNAAKAAADGQKLLPAGALKNKNSFRLYTRRLWMQLMSAYIAAPIREVYPEASVTNWIATLSLPQFPLLSCDNLAHPPMGPTLFTASNPVAYGIDAAFMHNSVKPPRTQLAVDRTYMVILLRQVSADAYARGRVAPEIKCVPWVARWVVDHPEKKTPMMSHSAYREALRHLWLRGVDAMQIFNPVRKAYRELTIQEVEDAVAVYNEMLGFRKFLDYGQPMNFAYPTAQTDSIVWSGLRLKNQALVRIFPLSGHRESLHVEPWPGTEVELEVAPAGVTYLLQRNEGREKITAKKLTQD